MLRLELASESLSAETKADSKKEDDSFRASKSSEKDEHDRFDEGAQLPHYSQRMRSSMLDDGVEGGSEPSSVAPRVSACSTHSACIA